MKDKHRNHILNQYKTQTMQKLIVARDEQYAKIRRANEQIDIIVEAIRFKNPGAIREEILKELAEEGETK